jgi:hypothetical protein
MARVLLEDVSPLGNAHAVVEANGDVCFFYLSGAPETKLGMRAVWVRNLKRAPKQFKAKRGEPPMNPQAFCKNAEAGALPTAEELRVCWLPEGNGAALFEREELLAVIPPQSGHGDFHGYARDCVGQGPVAWEMPKGPALAHRFEEAAAFWSAWETNLWPDIQDRLIESIEATLGKHSSYYAIDDDKWPPRALLRIPTQAGTVLITIGMSILPQPDLETDNARELRRVELGVLLPKSWSDASVQRFASYMSGQASTPWARLTWLGPGHTVECDAWSSSDLTAALLVREHPGLPRVALPAQFSDPVSVLWLVPITEREREHAIANGSAALLSTLPANRW